MAGKFKYNPLVKRGFDISDSGNGNNSSEFVTVGTGGDYPTIYDAIADDKKILMLISGTNENKPLSDVLADTGNITIFATGEKKEINFNASSAYYQNPAHIHFDNIIININTSNAFGNYINIRFTSNCIVNYNDKISNFCRLSDTQNIIADILTLNFNDVKSVGGNFILSVKELILNGNFNNNELRAGIYLTNSSVKKLFIKGTWKAEYSSNYSNYILLNYSGSIINYMRSQSNLNNTNVLIKNSGIIENASFDTPTDIYLYNELNLYGSLKNVKNIGKLILRSGYPLKAFAIENCTIDSLVYSAFWHGHYAPFRVFRHNIIKNSELKIYPGSCNIEDCSFPRAILYADKINITNCKATNGTININHRNKIILTNNRTLTPIIDNGTETEMSNNILI